MSPRRTRTASAATIVLATVVLVPLFLGLVLAVVSLAGRWQLRERQAFWNATLADLPAGSSRGSVERRFGSHGIELRCSPEREGITHCAGRDVHAYGVLPEWHLRFEVRFVDGSLRSVEQTALGVGL